MGILGLVGQARLNRYPAAIRQAIAAAGDEPATKRPKYGNHKVVYDGHKFDSKLERDTYVELRLQEAAGIIADLEVHPRYVFFDTDTAGTSREVCRYTPDFRYRVVRTGAIEVVDCKTFSTRTQSYGIKKRWMRIRFGIRIVEVYSYSERKGK